MIATQTSASNARNIEPTQSVSSTRVFVSGLPPKLTNEQLASHFQTHHAVTDAHVVPERRIGFVGFSSSEAAEYAVKHFNKSYIRMSKILVDLARPVEVSRDTSGDAAPLSKRNQGRNSGQSVEGPKKRKRLDKDDGEQLRDQTNELRQTQTGQKQGVQAFDNDARKPQVDTNETEARDTTDNDWLRSKTKRTLDLVEADALEDNSLRNTDDFRAETRALSEIGPDEVSSSEQQHVQDALDEVDRVPHARLFIRNLAFNVTEGDLQSKFTEFGKLQEVHIVKSANGSSSKGTAFVQFASSQEAATALKVLDGTPFQGRLLHVLPAEPKRDSGLSEYEISQMPVKKQRAIRRKMAASDASFSWNALYMNQDAVLSSIADRLGVSKTDILDPTSADAAVKQAHAETQLIKETKDYLVSSGVNIEAFKSQARDDKALLLKNFPYGTSEAELRELTEPFGSIRKFILPPAGTMAIVVYGNIHEASQALKSLAYKNIKGSVLFLEKAPKDLLVEQPSQAPAAEANIVSVKDNPNKSQNGPTTAVFVRNLNFSTSNAKLSEFARNLPGFISARIKTRTDAKKPGEVLSMGFGFIEFQSKSQAEAAVAAIRGFSLDGHSLTAELSSKSTDFAEEQRQQDKAKRHMTNQTKIIIKNLPFQASKKDIRSLFSPYGQLKKVRVPRKFDNTTRGFAFAEFVTPKEAENAMESLIHTHLLGRRLVLQFAQGDSTDPEEEIKAIEKKIEQQSNKVQVSKLLGGSGRKKFEVEAARDAELA